MNQRSDRVAVTTFLAYSILAGGNAVGVRFSNQELDPFWGATLRFGLAAILMLTLMVVTGHRIPRGRALLGASLYGLLAFGGAFAFAFYALVNLEAGFSQILLSIVPLLTLLLAVAQRMERLRLIAIVGALLALSGVIVMSGLTIEGDIPLLSILASLGSAFCFAQASLTIKRFPRVHPIVVNAVGMSVGALFLAALTFVTGNEVELPSQADTWWAIAYMVVVGSGLVFSLYVVVLKYWDASRVNYGFVIIPIVTVLVSAWLLDEQLTLGLIGGGALVLVGVYLGALRPVVEPDET
ncbi:MAG: DMT family transporter, partial [Acidimicrobiia bacterium]